MTRTFVPDVRAPWRRRVSMAIAIALAAQSVSAQTSTTGWSTTVAIGTLHTTRRNDAASPFRFSGRGAAGVLELERFTRHYRLLTELQGASLSLATGATQTNVQFKTGALAVGMLRQLTQSRALQVNAGIETRAGIDLTEHAFTLGSVARTKYRFATLTFAPDVRATSELPWGTVKLRVTAPAFGWVDHPYSEVKSADNAFRPRFATLRQLRRVDANISYTTRNFREARALLGLHASALNYRDALPVRAVSNTISAGLVLGGR